MKLYRVVLAAVLLAVALPIFAQAPQRIVRFSAGTTTGAESVVPSLKWCTETLPAGADPSIGNGGDPFACAPTPLKPATSCDATGPANWAGTKAASGAQTLPAITNDTTFALSCSWSDDTSITTVWTNPTQNTNGTALTDLDRIMFAFRQGAGTITTACVAPVRCETVKPPVSPQTFTGFALGSWRVVGWAVNAAGTFSDPTPEVTKVNLPAQQVGRNVTITVSGKPNTLGGVLVL